MPKPHQVWTVAFQIKTKNVCEWTPEVILLLPINDIDWLSMPGRSHGLCSLT